jgi:tellurite resistance protein TerC
VWVSRWLWIATFLAAGTLLSVAAMLLRSRLARSHRLVLGWLATTAILLLVAVAALGWAGGPDDAMTLLSEYAQEAPFAIDTILAFALILRRYLPDGDHATAALYGVVTTLILRAGFLGAVTRLLYSFSWLFYLIGALLLYTAFALVNGRHDQSAGHDGVSKRWPARTVLKWGRRQRTNGLAYLPPMAVAVVLLTLEDPLAWPDGGPVYQTILANILALLPVPVLVVYSEKLLSLIRYLPTSLGLVGSFLGIKIVFIALHFNAMPFLNGAHGVHWAPTISPYVSFLVTAGTFAVALTVSLAHKRRVDSRRQTAALPGPSTDLAPEPRTGLVSPPRTTALISGASPSGPGPSLRTGSTATALTITAMAGLVILTSIIAYHRRSRRYRQRSTTPTAIPELEPGSRS